MRLIIEQSYISPGNSQPQNIIENPSFQSSHQCLILDGLRGRSHILPCSFIDKIIETLFQYLFLIMTTCVFCRDDCRSHSQKRRWIPPSTVHRDALSEETRNDLVFRKVGTPWGLLQAHVSYNKVLDCLLHFCCQ